MSDVALKPALVEGMAEFIELISSGLVGPLNAALSVGWTPRDLRRLESDPDFIEIMDQCTTRRIESIEAKAFELAYKGNASMIQMILYCHAADRGWRPPTQRVAVHHQGVVAVEKIQATKAALLEIMAEHGPEALAIGGPLDAAIEATSTDDSQ